MRHHISRRFAGGHGVSAGIRPQGRRGRRFAAECTPIFFSSCRKENGRARSKEKAPVPTKWPLAIWRQKREYSESVQLGLRFAGPSMVFCRVRRTGVEQRWVPAASCWLGRRFRGWLSDGLASSTRCRFPGGCRGGGRGNRGGLPPQAGSVAAAFVGAYRMDLLLFPLPLLWWLSGEGRIWNPPLQTDSSAPCFARRCRGAERGTRDVGADSISARCSPNALGQRKRKEKDRASLNSPGRAFSQGPSREAS
jgi:hypothetical protein